jgi:hypothetical protein
MYIFFISATRATYPAHLILFVLFMLVLGEEYKYIHYISVYSPYPLFK